MRKKKVTWRKPEGVSIKPHRMGYQFDRATVPDKWYQNNAYVTTWMESLSLLFPEGEAFFVRSVRAHRDIVKDKRIQKEISGFIGQEAMHSLEHESFNDYIASKGLPAKELDKWVGSLLKGVEKRVPKLHQLAVTTALEHITAMLANVLLEDDGYSENVRNSIDEKVLDLWLWHAIEETEHKAVAFDLYQEAGGYYLHRTVIMAITTTIFLAVLNYFHFRMMKAGGYLRNYKDIIKGLGIVYGINGYVPRLIPEWLRYFKPGFHPWDHDNSALIERWKAKILQGKDKYVEGDTEAPASVAS